MGIIVLLHGVAIHIVGIPYIHFLYILFSSLYILLRLFYYHNAWLEHAAHENMIPRMKG
jgi:hypothetical protein